MELLSQRILMGQFTFLEGLDKDGRLLIQLPEVLHLGAATFTVLPTWSNPQNTHTFLLGHDRDEAEQWPH